MSAMMTRVVYGAVGGAVGACCMTVIRMLARRRGVIDKTVPQVIEEWMADRTSAGGTRNPVAHHLADQALHVGYGATLGAIYGLTSRARRSGVLARGGTFGAGTWVFGSALLLPALGAKRPSWEQSLMENAVDLGAHLAFGWATALVCGELAAQPDHGPTSDLRRAFTRVG